MVMIMMLGKGKGEGKKEHTPRGSWVKGILDADKLDKLNKELADAVIRADPKKVKEALNKGADPNTKDSGRPLLEWVVTLGRSRSDEREAYGQIAEILLNAGANENIRERITTDHSHSFPEPPLRWAVAFRFRNVVEILIKRKVNLDEIWWGYTPLMLAAANGDMEIVRMLVEAGANIALSNGYWTAEDLARQNGHIEVAEYLKNKAAE
jgi:ankyrin repeat protein